MPFTASCQGSVLNGSKPAPLSLAEPAMSPTMCQVTGESSRSSHLHQGHNNNNNRPHGFSVDDAESKSGISGVFTAQVQATFGTYWL